MIWDLPFCNATFTSCHFRILARWRLSWTHSLSICLGFWACWVQVWCRIADVNFQGKIGIFRNVHFGNKCSMLSFEKKRFSPQIQTRYRSFYTSPSLKFRDFATVFFSPEVLLVWSIWWRTIQRCRKSWKMKLQNCWTMKRCRVPQRGTAVSGLEISNIRWPFGRFGAFDDRKICAYRLCFIDTVQDN